MEPKRRPPPSRVHGLLDGLAQQRRPAIGEAFGERRVVARGILVEQPAHVGFAHRRRGVAGAEPGELEPRAVIILGVRVAGLLERGNGAGAIAEPVADGAEREPGGGESGRQRPRSATRISAAPAKSPRAAWSSAHL